MALALYRRALRTARTWNGGEHEQEYIRNEARRLVEVGRILTDKNDIQNAIQNGHDRIDIAIHYQIPYERIYYGDPRSVADNFNLTSSREQTSSTRASKSKIMKSFKHC